MEELSQTPSKGIKSNYGDTVINQLQPILEDYIHDNNEMFDASRNSTQDQNNVTLEEDVIIKDYIIKANKIVHNVNKIFSPVIPNKRSGKIRKLRVEEFTFDVYTRSQSGFLTPVEWAIALENYIENTENTSCRWLEKKDATERIYNSKVYLYFNKTNSVTVSINFVAGVIMVNGELYEKWIKSEFPKVSEEYQKLRSGPNITNLIEEKTSEYKAAKLSEDTYEPIWEKYAQSQNAFNTLSDSLNGLHTRVTEVEKERCAGKEEAIEQSVALDKKVCMFMETITKDAC